MVSIPFWSLKCDRVAAAAAARARAEGTFTGDENAAKGTAAVAAAAAADETRIELRRVILKFVAKIAQ